MIKILNQYLKIKKKFKEDCLFHNLAIYFPCLCLVSYAYVNKT